MEKSKTTCCPQEVSWLKGWTTEQRCGKCLLACVRVAVSEDAQGGRGQGQERMVAKACVGLDAATGPGVKGSQSALWTGCLGTWWQAGCGQEEAMAPRSTVSLSLGDGQNDSALRATKRLSLQKAKHIYLKPQTALLMQKKKKVIINQEQIQKATVTRLMNASEFLAKL